MARSQQRPVRGYLVFVVLLVCSWWASRYPAVAFTDAVVQSQPGVVLVKLRAQSAGQSDLMLPANATVEAELAPGLVALRVPTGTEERSIRHLSSLASVEYAQRDHRARAQVRPDDPRAAEQWHLGRIGMERAWDVVSDTTTLAVAVLDTGMKQTHPDLAAARWINDGEIAGNRRDDDGNGFVDDVHGWHFYHSYSGGEATARDDGVLDDPNGHGTHVAGIIGAVGDNATGVTGISWRSRLMVVRVLDEDAVGWESDIIRGMQYALRNGADIINLSLGLANAGPALRDVIAEAERRGVVVVAAAGNTSGAVLYPAAYPTVIAVGASDRDDQRARFSSYGAALDLVAPGVDILSTWNGVPYFVRSGTSMAAPQVAGVAALFKANYPRATPADVRRCLTLTAHDLAALGRDDRTGWGRVNADRAVRGCAAPLFLPLVSSR